ncbi:hypothetical protein [Paraburkholderia sp. J63]|uniref:hypothetical protein n=1 Tax=Paraburkholderia sp. J63 TaxID=2805434 RepID=UPI002ABD4C25|nr:hypothetical protein [Paraburkholderia sp. J63]
MREAANGTLADGASVVRRWFVDSSPAVIIWLIYCGFTAPLLRERKRSLSFNGVS